MGNYPKTVASGRSADESQLLAREVGLEMVSKGISTWS